MQRILTMILVFFAIVGPVSAVAQVQHLGDLAFANSGDASAQAPFLRGLALLHNFEYEEAAVAFRGAQKADPTFVMAYWGEAMTYNHAVWMEQDLGAGRAVLLRLAPTSQARAKLARTPREASYLAAIEVLYGAGHKEARDDLYAAAMGRIHEDYPDDVDATAFYALSLLGTAHAGRDFAIYMRSAALLEEVFPAHPEHPGVLQYLIQSYDDPVHAPLGLRAARLYGKVAASAPHALHMTSHIFIALGNWDEVIAANVSATRADNAGEEARGLPPRACGHYEEWLVYGYLQKDAVIEADERIAACRKTLDASLNAPHRSATPAWPVLSYADMLVRRAVETGQWPVQLLPTLDQSAFVEARFNLAYGEALTATQEPERLHGAADRMRGLLMQLEVHKAPPGSEAQWAQVLAVYRVMVEEITALKWFADGQAEQSLQALQRAVELEAALPFDFGPPAIPKPTLELLGDLMLAMGRPIEAQLAYQRTLARTPGRRLAVMGLARAQESMVHVAIGTAVSPSGGYQP